MLRATITLLSLLAVFLALGGCQSEGTLRGEVFVATKGGTNVQLGDLKVKAIPASKWEGHLQERYRRAEKIMAEKMEKAKPLLDSLEALRSRLKKARERIEEAESSYENAVGSSGSYGLPSANQTEVLYTRVEATFRESRFGELIATIPSGEELIPIEEAEEHYRVSYSGREGWVKKVAISSKEKYEYEKRRSRLESELGRIAEACQSTRDSLMDLTRGGGLREYSYYFLDVPKSEDTDRTDSEGKFKLTLTQGTPYYLVAHRSRSVGDSEEEYYWTVETTLRENSGEVILSNSNMETALPDSLDAVANSSIDTQRLTRSVERCE